MALRELYQLQEFNSFRAYVGRAIMKYFKVLSNLVHFLIAGGISLCCDE